MTVSSTGVLAGLSPSAMQAVRWAMVAASSRERLPPGPRGPAVRADDLLVGILLAHPDHDNEARVLLEHFGQTARDVLPADYPPMSADELSRRAREVPPSVEPVLSPSTEDVLRQARTLALKDRVRLHHLFGGLLLVVQPSTEVTESLSAALSDAGSGLGEVARSYAEWNQTDPAEKGVAGQSLRQWLRTAMPRQPVDIPSYAPDRVDAGTDLIGISVEADAFAYLIASRNLRPPMAIGLFGDWGSGKSYLMSAVQHRVRRLCDLVGQTSQAAGPVWKRIKQIEFNAWEYVQGDLWAGLLERIFRELGSVPTPTNLVNRARQPLVDQLSAEQARIANEVVRLVQLRNDTHVLEQALEAAEDAAREAHAEAERKTQELLTSAAEKSVRDALTKIWGEQRVNLLGSDAADLLDALGEAKVEVQRGRTLLGPFWRSRRRIALAAAAAALIPIVAFLLTVLHVPPLVSLLGGLATLVPVVASALRSATNWTSQRLSDLEAAEATVRVEVQRTVDDAERRVTEARQALDGATRQFEAQQAQVDTSRQRAGAIEERISSIDPARVFVEFADERSSDYRRRLGLLATVREDLTELDAEVRSRNLALDDRDSMPNRIVLYVDDLDRCPPDKVLEVLEAVHLLLAFEMFVVVVAVDTRWLSAALTDQLHALRDGGQSAGHPTPQDYLEKIFQLPFWVQPLGEGGRTNLIRGLLGPSVRAEAGAPVGPGNQSDLSVGPKETEVIDTMLGRPGSGLRLETSQLALSPEDLQFIGSLAPLLGDTPRRVKRFVNTCQFLLAMRPPLRRDGVHPPERHVVCLVAAINEGLPSVARALALAAKTDAVGTLETLMTDLADSDFTRLREWLDKYTIWKNVALTSLAVRLDMIQRLRFTPPGRAT